MFEGIIYCAISPSNKKYYGKTAQTLQRRISNHLAQSKMDKTYFHRAIKKYGINNFKWIIVENCVAKNKNDLNNILNEREKYWIKKDNTKILGYNLTSGGDGGDFNSGKKFSDEVKLKQSIARKGRRFSEEHKQNLSLSIKFVKDNESDEKKKERKTRLLGEKNPMYGIKKENHPMYGKHHSLKAINSIREKNKINFSGEKNPMFGISPEKILCRHCNKKIDKRNYSRWHGNKCKQKQLC